jgi:aryl-alcohol dehydrogenase
MTNAVVGARHDVTVAVVREKGARFQIERASIDPPGPDEVIVRVVATGVCHTDMLVRDQDYPVPLPVVLGHEGSGIVEAVGSAVVGVRPGDHVVMT